MFFGLEWMWAVVAGGVALALGAWFSRFYVPPIKKKTFADEISKRKQRLRGLKNSRQGGKKKPVVLRTKKPPPLPKKKDKQPPPLPTKKPTLPKFDSKKGVRNGKGLCKKQKRAKLVELVEVVTRAQKGLFKGPPVEGTVVGACKGSKKKKVIETRTDKAGVYYMQFVNLPKDLDGAGKLHPEYGRYVELRARIEWEDDSCHDDLTGHYVFWEYKHYDEDGRPADLRDGEKEGFLKAGGAKVYSSTTDKEGWTRPVKFYLSSYGGDRFRIKAAIDPEGNNKPTQSLKTDCYQVYRRMWYAITQMKTANGKGLFAVPDRALQRIRKAFDWVFLEFKDSGERKKGKYVENFPSDEAVEKWATKYCTRKYTPWKVHFAVVNHATRKVEKLGELLTINANPFVWRPDFVPYTYGKTNWLVRTRYRPPQRSWMKLASTMTLNVNDNDKKNVRVTVTFPGTAFTRWAGKAQIQFKYLEAENAMGWGGNDLHMVICRGTHDDSYRNDARELERQMTDTCVHETGHGFDLVTQAWKTTNALRGAHCKERTCVMWYTGSPKNVEPGYHDDNRTNATSCCRTWMRRYVMVRTKMTRWKYP